MKRLSSFSLLLSAALLASCGGGGGGGTTTDPVAVLPQPEVEPITSEPEPEPEVVVEEPEPEPEIVVEEPVMEEPEPELVMEKPCINAFFFNPQTTENDIPVCLTRTEFDVELNEWSKTIKEIEQPFEYRNLGQTNWWREMVNAYQAYAIIDYMGHKGSKPGEGITVGFIDSGIHEDHPSFVHIKDNIDVLTHINSDIEEDWSPSHGTNVAGAIAGPFAGIARNVNLVMFGARNIERYGGDFVDLDYIEWLQVFDYDVDILNLSFGYNIPDAEIESFNKDFESGAMSREGFFDLFEATIGEQTYALLDTPIRNRPIIVQAAGNESQRNANVNSMVGIIATNPDGFDDVNFVTVVSVDRNGIISTFSNRCGYAADWCIAAPGEDLKLPSYDVNYYSGELGFYETLSGTSYAAPIVSGGLAIMKQIFRGHLSDRQIVDRLFATANDSGRYALEEIYGHGLMDLGAATNPWGIPSFMSTLSSTGNDVSDTVISVSTPLGDSLSQSLASEEVAAFDSLGAPFWFDANSFTVPSSGTSIASRLHHFNNINRFQSLPDEWKFSLKENASSGNIGHLSLTDGSSQFTIQSPYGVSTTVYSDTKDKEGVSVSWTPKNLDNLTMEVGYLDEHQSLLGSHAKGAFGSLSSETFFIGSELSKTIGEWKLTAQGEIGQVNPSVGHSLFIDDISSLTTSAFNLEATRDFIGSSVLSFSIGQPLRVENGSIDLSLPVGRTHDGTLLNKSLSASLSPSGRQLDFTTKLEFPWLKGDVALGATFSNQPKHQLSVNGEWTMFAGYRAKW